MVGPPIVTLVRGRLYTAGLAIATLVLGAFVIASPPLLLACACTCGPPPELPSAPWTAAILLAGVAGATAVLYKRGGGGKGGGSGGGSPKRKRLRVRTIGGGLAAVVLMSAVSSTARVLTVSDAPALVSAGACDCPPAPKPTSSVLGSGTAVSVPVTGGHGDR